VIAVVGLGDALSPPRPVLEADHHSLFAANATRGGFTTVAFNCFWAALFAVCR